MRVSSNCLDLIKEFEQGPGGGFAPRPYVCPAGFWTIGWGHRIMPDERAKYENAVLTEQEADDLLLHDLKVYADAVNRYVTVPLTQNQFDALVSFTYNVGPVAFRASTLLELLDKGNYKGASAQFDEWVYASHHKLTGLVRRRNAEEHLFLAGQLFKQTKDVTIDDLKPMLVKMPQRIPVPSLDTMLKRGRLV